MTDPTLGHRREGGVRGKSPCKLGTKCFSSRIIPKFTVGEVLTPPRGGCTWNAGICNPGWCNSSFTGCCNVRACRLCSRLNISHLCQVISLTHCQMFSFSQWIELMVCACIFEYIYFCNCFYGQQWQIFGMNLRGNIVPILQCSFFGCYSGFLFSWVV